MTDTNQTASDSSAKPDHQNKDDIAHEQEPTAPVVQRKRVYENGLRLAVFDDGEQVHCIWTPFFSFSSDGFVTYKEPDNCARIPRDEQVEMRVALPLIRYNNPERAYMLRWIRIHADLREDPIFLDLESDGDYTFGKVMLGIGKRKRGNNLKQTDSDGVTVRYSLSYDASHGEAGETWFCLHEITLPLSRLKRGVSNSNF